MDLKNHEQFVESVIDEPGSRALYLFSLFFSQEVFPVLWRVMRFIS